MSVNGIKLAAGQKWKTKNYGVVTLSERGVSSNYPWRMNFPNNGNLIGSVTTDGKYLEEDEMPELLECIYNPEDKEEPRHTVDEVFDALFEETKHIDIEVPLDYIDDVKEHLSRKNDPQYMEYLRLKAIYE